MDYDRVDTDAYTRAREYYGKAKAILGKQVVDSITGLQGTVTAYTVWLNGCVRVCITPRVKEDGTLAEDLWVDYQQAQVKVANEPLTVAGALDNIKRSFGGGDEAVIGGGDNPPSVGIR